MPTVTAIIPTYNRSALVVEAIESVLAQTQPVTQIIVADDGSTDATPDVVGRYGSRVQYVRQTNKGPGAARNLGIRHATGDLIALLDSDDLWVPRKMEQQLEFLRANPSVEFLFGNMAIVRSASDPDIPEIKDPAIHRYLVAHATNLEALFEQLLIENVVPTSSVVMTRACVQRIGFFDEHLRIAEDLDYWLRVTRQCQCGFLDAVVERRRRHEGNLINDWAKTSRYHAEVLTRVAESRPAPSAAALDLIKRRVSSLYYDLGSHYLKTREFRLSRHYLKKGMPGRLIDPKWTIKLLAATTLSWWPGQQQPLPPLKTSPATSDR
jgi:glycosyltransferase involved in cell wall biosynthesis